jgi:hypothetical protein
MNNFNALRKYHRERQVPQSNKIGLTNNVIVLIYLSIFVNYDKPTSTLLFQLWADNQNIALTTKRKDLAVKFFYCPSNHCLTPCSLKNQKTHPVRGGSQR